MRPQISLVISVILMLNLFVSQAHGSALEKKANIGTATVSRGTIFNGISVGDVVRKEALGLCQGRGHCLGKGRKLLMKSPIVSTKEKVRKEQASARSDVDKKPDVLDIAGMDYSPAKRKPPIHN